MFFGYDLPEDITEDDILSFLEEYEQSIVSIDVELNEKHGNYARITFETSTDAREAMRYYSGQYWYELGIYVVLKPWKEKERSQEKKQQRSKHSYDDYDDNFSTCSESVQQSRTRSYNSSRFLLPYPGSNESKAGEPIISEDDVKSAESKQQEKKLTVPRSSGSRKEEYTIKISGLSFDIKEKDILKLVKPFGDLTSPIKIASYPDSGICYAYVNYCRLTSARAAVSELDRSEFNDVRIHVCHRGKLGVDHSCRKELQELAEEEYIDIDMTTDPRSVDSVKQVQDASILHLPQVGAQQPEASGTSTSKALLKPQTNLPRPDISDVDSSPYRSDVSHEGSLAKLDTFSKVLKVEKPPPNAYNSLHAVKQATKKSRNVTSYASVAKSPPKSVEKVSSGKIPSHGVSKKSKKSKVDRSSSDLKPYTMPIKQLGSSIDNSPDIDPTKKQITVASDESVDQTLPKCVQVLFDSNTLAQHPEFYTDTIDTTISKSHIRGYCHSEDRASNTVQILSDDPSSSLNVPPTVSPHRQLTETFTDMTSHSFVTHSSPQAIKSVQDAKPDHALRQQPKFDPNAVRSNCVLEVTNLHPDTCVQDLDRYFKPYGALKAPISIRLHLLSDSCSAIVHYVSADSAQNAMRELNGCDISGYQMHIVNPNDKDAGMKISADVTPVVSDSTTVDVSLVGSNNLHTPVKKTVENTTALSAQ